MIELFKLNHSVEASEVGNCPQVAIKWPGPTDFWASNSFTMKPLNGPINFEIVFPEFEVDKYGKLTDWVSVGGSINRDYLMVTNRFFDLLMLCEIDEYQHFPAPVQTPQGIVHYHLIYFPWPRGDDFIDWSKSVFRRVDSKGKISFVQFQNTKERQLAKDAHEIEIEKLVVRAERITMDIFRFLGFETGFYVTARLKDAMVESGMTGIRYEPAEWLAKSSMA